MNKRNSSSITPIPFETICAAVEGDAIALQRVLKHYRKYICKLCQCTYIDPRGAAHYYLDEELKQELEAALLERILRFKIE